MSEIFSWLKKAELEKRTARTGAQAPSIQVSEVPDFGKIIPGSELSPSVKHAAPEKIVIRDDARFDLAGADQRIREVLDPVTLVGEQYRLLRAKLSQLQKQKGIKTLLVTSSIPAEGKTFTACCLAGVFAQETGRRVLLIDADLRKPRAEHELGVNHAGQPDGLSQVLRGERVAEEALLHSAKTDLFLLPAGPVPEDPAELLSSPSLELVIKRMSQIFDWVVIDSPPIMALADSSLLAPLCDTTLLVVRAGKTPSKLIQESIERIGRDRICGVLMNRSRRVRSSHYYYHYYHKDRRP